jgi:glutathione S-transferase
LTLVESLAILVDLEAKYPTPALLPTEAKALGIVRMVEMVALIELLPAMFPLTGQILGVAGDTAEKFEELLADDSLRDSSASRTDFAEEHNAKSRSFGDCKSSHQTPRI